MNEILLSEQEKIKSISHTQFTQTALRTLLLPVVANFYFYYKDKDGADIELQLNHIFNNNINKLYKFFYLTFYLG